MKISITIDFKNYLKNNLVFSVRFDLENKKNRIILNAIAVKAGIRTSNLVVLDNKSNYLDYIIKDNIITVNERSFIINYTLNTIFTDCVGFNKKIEFLYPFINQNELFLGSGSIPYPENLSEISNKLKITTKIINKPEFWNTLSNIKFESNFLPITDTFFIYSSNENTIHKYTFHGQKNIVDFQIVIQKNKKIPISINKLFSYINDYCIWLENNLIPLKHVDKINIIILQTTDNFTELTGNEAMATAENMLNTIIIYGPDNNKYYKKLLNYSDYTKFLYDAITHELMHSYTTMSWQGKYKSILYPDKICPNKDARFIGEALNIYFHNYYIENYFSNSNETFITKIIFDSFINYIKNGNDSLMRLFLLDFYLKKNNSSLLELFSELLKHTKKPYNSLKILFDTSKKYLNITINDKFKKIILNERIADTSVIKSAFEYEGYKILKNNKIFEVSKI